MHKDLHVIIFNRREGDDGICQRRRGPSGGERREGRLRLREEPRAALRRQREEHRLVPVLLVLLVFWRLGRPVALHQNGRERLHHTRLDQPPDARRAGRSGPRCGRDNQYGAARARSRAGIDASVWSASRRASPSPHFSTAASGAAT